MGDNSGGWQTLLVLAMALTSLAGVIMIVMDLLQPDRRYLRYLGIAFVFLGIALGVRLIFPFTWYYLLPTIAGLVTIVLAFYQAAVDTKARLARYHAQEKDREAAFAEYLTAITRKEQSCDTGAEPPPPAPPV
jgi:hypothetical protein